MPAVTPGMHTLTFLVQSHHFVLEVGLFYELFNGNGIRTFETMLPTRQKPDDYSYTLTIDY